jgi:Alginate export
MRLSKRRLLLVLFAISSLIPLKAEDRPPDRAGSAQASSDTSGQAGPKSDWLGNIKEHLPNWFDFGGQYRGRVEGQTGREFISGNNDFYYLSQLRLDLRIRISSNLRLMLEGQDSRAPKLDLHPRPASFQNSFDLRQGYLELHRGDLNAVGVQLGRQELSFGEERLIGAGNWSNTSRSFDAARLYVSTPSGRLDVLAASLVRTRDGDFDSPQLRGNNLYGAYASLKTLLRQSTVEPFLFYRTIHQVRNEAGMPGSAGFYTFGARLIGDLPKSFDYNIEMAGERGTYARDPFRAWAGHWSLGYTAKQAASRPHLLLEYNYGSGDTSPQDGRRETFDQLFPTNHSKYGTADVIGWRNMHNLRAGVEQTFKSSLKVSYDYHSHWLATGTDALYSDNGTPLARVTGGVVNRHVGQEFDVVLSYKISKQYRFGFGYGYLWAGPFLQQATAHGNVSYPYSFLTYSF